MARRGGGMGKIEAAEEKEGREIHQSSEVSLLALEPHHLEVIPDKA